MGIAYSVFVADKDELIVLRHGDVPDFMQHRYTTARSKSANQMGVI